MWLLLFRRSAQVAASPPKEPGSSPPRMSFFRRTRRALDKFARSPVGFFACHFILVLMVLGNIYLYVDWWETNFPKPPLGILTGELLKAFDRYSPEDNHSEEVLAEVFGPDVETRIPCITPGCQWLEKERNGTPLVGRSAAACDDFYSHVCGGRPGRLASLHQRAAEDLMAAVVDHLLTVASPGNNDHDTAEHLRVLRKCVNGEEAMEFALTCDSTPSSTDSDFRCPDHYPFVPRTQSEIIFKADTPTTAEELVSRIERSLRKPNASVTLEHEGRKRSHIMTQRVRSFCRWLADSARCHLRELFTNGSEDDITSRYQRLWNELFFAPLSLSQDGIALWELGGGGEAARKRACAQIHEALFRAESAKAATAVLDGLTGDVRATVEELVEHAQYILNQRVPYWMSRHEEGEITRLQEKRRPAYLAELDAVQVELAGLAAPSADDYGTSIYSSKVSYDRTRNVLTVPHGLLAPLTEERDVMEPVMTVLVSAPLLHALLPRPTGPYSWKDPHDQHLSYVMECFRSVHSATMDVNGDAALLRELVYESALLGPLFDAYRMAVIEYFDKSVNLSKDYDNWQLFFVIWTMSHCGDPRGGDLLNAVLRNSVRFTRSFDCGMKDAMFSRRKCNFWVYW